MNSWLLRYNSFLQQIAQRPRVAAGLLWVIVILVFSQALTADYVAYDEHTDVLGNPVINAPLTMQALKQIFFSFASNANQYTPMSVASFWLEQNLFGFNSAISHFINLLLHLGCAALVFRLAVFLTGSALTGWFISLLWAVHPFQVDTVAWVLERRNLLYALPLFASLVSYADFCDTGKSRYRHLALFFMLLSGLAKTLAFFVPLAWLIIDFARGRTLNPSLLREKIPALLLSLIFVCLMFAGAMGGMATTSAATLDYNLATYGISFYTAKTLLPTNLSPVFEANFANEKALASGPWLFLVTMCVLLWAGSRNRLAAAGILFFLGTILPLSGIIRVGQRFYAASHFMYVPLFGLLLALAAICADLSRRGWLRQIMPLLASIAVVCAAVLSFSHCSIWRNTETLYGHALRLDPDNGFARRNLAAYYHETKDTARAIVHYEELVRRYPEGFADRFNLAGIFLRRGDYHKAIENFQELLRRFPGRYEIFSGLAGALYLTGDFAGSLAMSAQAIELARENGSLYYNRALTRFAAGDLAGADEDYSRAISLEVGNVRALLMRAEVRRSMGRYSAAVDDIMALSMANPDNLIAMVKLFELFCEKGDPGAAMLISVDLVVKLRHARPERLEALSDIYGNAFIDFLLRLLPFRGLIGYWVQ